VVRHPGSLDRSDAVPRSDLDPRSDAVPRSDLDPRSDAVPPSDLDPRSDAVPPSDAAPRSDPALRSDLERLVRAIEVGSAAAGPRADAPAALRTGWPGLDRALGVGAGEPAEEAAGLALGVLHEWVGLDVEGDWTPPLLLLAHLARRALEERLGAGGRRATARVLWIGRRVWPYPRALLLDAALREVGGRGAGARRAGELELLLALEPRGTRPGDGRGDERGDGRDDAGSPLFARSLFVDPTDDASRLWAIDAALRCASSAAVVADGSGFGMAASRRLQLAARAGGALALVARPPGERGEPSVATTRWEVRSAACAQASAGDGGGACGVEPAEGWLARWRLRLLRCKGVQRRSRSPGVHGCSASRR